MRAQDFSPAGFVSNEFEIEWPPRSGTMQSFPEVDRAEWVVSDRARELLVRGQVEFIDRLLGADPDLIPDLGTMGHA